MLESDIVESDARPVAVTGTSRLGDLLVERNLVTQSQLSEALLQQEVSGKRLGTLLIELGAVDELECTRILGEQLGIPLADLR